MLRLHRLERTARRLLLLAAFCGGVSSGAAAGDDCPQSEALPSFERLPALASELARHAVRCARNAGFLAWQGAVLNALGRSGEAALILERALLLDPDQPGARLDYAFALAALGDTAAAAALLHELVGRSDLPEGLRAPLERRVEQLQQLLSKPQWRTRGALALRAGYENNLNQAPVHDSIALTFPGGEVSLLLSERYRARSGGTLGFEGMMQAARPLQGGGRWDLAGDLRGRWAPQTAAADYLQLDVSTQWAQPVFADGEALTMLGVSALRFGGQDLYRALRLGLARDWLSESCRPRLGLEAEWRSYPDARELDGSFLGLAASTVCTSGTYRQMFALRLGYDRARAAQRPGGDQQRIDLRHAYTRPWRGGRLDADLSLAVQSDGEGYSPLLNYGARRWLHRLAFRIEYSQPLRASWEAMVSGEFTRQRSNLALFDVDGRALWLGLRRRW